LVVFSASIEYRKAFVKLFLIYLTLFLTSKLIANDSCYKIFVYDETSVQVNIQVDKNLPFSELMAHQKNKVIAEINNQLDPAMIPKRNINIQVKTSDSDVKLQEKVTVNEEDCLITVDHGKIASQIKNKEAYDPALAHEYGHVIFYEYVRPRLTSHPLNQKMLQTVQKARDEIIAIKQDKSISREDKNLDFARIEKLKKVIMKNEELPNFFSMEASRTYNEFFADFIAILHTNDLSAVSKYLKNTRGRNLESRNFLSDIGTEKWTEMVDANNELKSPHAFFAPTRAYIGKKLAEKWPLTNSQKQKIIKQVADAIVEELAYLNTKRDLVGPSDFPDSAEINYSYLDPSKLNVRLIKALNRIFK
jgi:hypothetical protein